MSNTAGYAIGRKLEQSFEQVFQRVKDELQKEEFGVLSEIDVQATLRASSARRSSPI
jgi:uncharacterized protein (DUF302 family)